VLPPGIRIQPLLKSKDTANRKFSGLIGVQVHVGPPMKIEYRTFLLKVLP
jgi:hypothetical protein